VLTTPSASEAASLNANTESEAPPVDSGPVRRRSLLPAVLICSALLGVAIGFVARRLIDEQSPPQPPGFASSVLWAPFFDDDLPLLVVVGDYYIFGEVDGRGDVVQLVRDFDVNSRH